MNWDRTKGRPEPVHLLNRIREIECGEPLVDMREVAPSIRILRAHTIPYCRKTVAEMAERAAQRMPKGVHMAMTEAWRPIQRQQRIYDFMMKCALEAFPDRQYSSLKRTVNRWVAPTDQKAPPGHCTGAALDINLVDDSGEVINVWAPYERFLASPTYTLGLTEEAQYHRNLLIEAMLAEGFSNCRDEWWHYSYGDAGWAVRVGADECIYGLVHLDPALYESLEDLAAEAIAARPNPFLDPS